MTRRRIQTQLLSPNPPHPQPFSPCAGRREHAPSGEAKAPLPSQRERGWGEGRSGRGVEGRPPLKLAYLCSDLGIPVHGDKGASIHIRELTRALQALGHEVEIFTCRAGGEAPPDFAVPVHELGLGPPEAQVYTLLREDPSAGAAAATAVRAMLAATTLRHRADPLLRQFRPDAIYERYALFGTAGATLARELDVPLILEVNAPLSDEQAAHRGLAFGQTARAVEQTVLRAADHLIAVSRQVADWLIEIGVEPARIRVLPNGVDVDRFAAGERQRAAIRAELGLDPTGPVVGFVGTLKVWHGAETLLRAAATLHRRIPNDRQPPHLLIVGDGPECANLQELARREGIAATTTFTGAVRHDRMPAYLAAMDVAVAPYDRAPNFYFSPLKLFEYLAAGRPVVAAAIGQIEDCVRHEETGLLYPPGDVEALADAIDTLLADPAYATTLGRAGQDDVRQDHTWLGNAVAVIELARAGRAAMMGAR